MNLGEVTKRSVLHETGHALGFGHEHQHPQGNIQWNSKAVSKSHCVLIFIQVAVIECKN